MTWKKIESLADLSEAMEESRNKKVILFKHSTRCSVSMMAKKSLEMSWDISPDEVQPYFLDLIKYRNVSNEISAKLQVIHQSPQLIGVNNEEVFYHASHSVISVESLKSAL
ncbi:MAG: bacillithiol system redox-active protein YtxJ [Flavobacteriales bacterium]|jgi:bacillithiol system protein YtxJ